MRNESLKRKNLKKLKMQKESRIWKIDFSTLSEKKQHNHVSFQPRETKKVSIHA